MIRRAGESVVVGVGLLLIPLLPRVAILALARTLAGLGFRFWRRLRDTGRANLDVAVRAGLPVPDRDIFLRQCFGTFALVMLDVFWFSRFTRRRLARYVVFDPSMDCHSRKTSLLAITAHLGNWELLGMAVAFYGAPSLSVAAPLENAVADRAMARLRHSTGQRIVMKEGATRTLLRELRGGGKVALLLDQNVTPDEGGEFVSFFGLPAPMSRAAALLSERTGAPVVLSFCAADVATGRYRAYSLPPISADEARAFPGGATQRFACAMEQEIRRYPDQWLWMYKRWKHIPDGRSADEYPRYAKRWVPRSADTAARGGLSR